MDISRKWAPKKFRGLWPTGPRLEARAKHDRIPPLAGLGILGRPKGENRIAHGLQPWEDVPPGGIALQGRPSVGHYSQRSHSEFPQNAGPPAEFLSRRQHGQSGVKGTEPSYITTHPYVVVSAIRTPLQGDFLGRVVPRAEAALGCFLFALRALGTRTIQKQDRIMLPAGLDILGRPKGENRIAQRLQPWEAVPERNRPERGGRVSVIILE